MSTIECLIFPPVRFVDDITIDYNTDVVIEIFNLQGEVIRKIINNKYEGNTQQLQKVDLSANKEQMLFIVLTTNKGSILKKVIPSGRK